MHHVDVTAAPGGHAGINVQQHFEETEGLLEDRVEIGGVLENGQPKVLASPAEQLDSRMDLARALVTEDPKRAVQVIKNWLTSEA